MPQIELKLRKRLAPIGKPMAWYLSGSEPREWLRQIALWPVDHAAVRLVVIRKEENMGVAGALAIPPAGDYAIAGYGLPYQKIGKNLYLPVDADLVPKLSEREIAELFTEDYTYVWVPGRGLTAAESGQKLSLRDLIVIPPAAQMNWGKAVPGIAFSNRIAAIFPEKDFSIEEVISEGRGDIGDRSNEITKLPKAPKEPMPGLQGAVGRAATVVAAKSLLGLVNLGSAIGNILPEGSKNAGTYSNTSGTSLLSMLREKANQLMSGVNKAIEDRRHKEIGRLLSMLDSDPDQGLKFAIPMGGGDAHRGLSSPGARLGERNINFSLSGIGGGGAADFWDMSANYRQRLLAKYRELAAREGRLGKHRRAAYIYAELLGDIRSAASTLEQGGYFREAAVLYRDRLGNAQAAAECLERGALLSEAIELYRKLDKHEKIGDLQSQLEQYELAAEAYQTAADKYTKRDDLLNASRIYELKLRNGNLAIETLDAGWPDSSQAKNCIKAAFALRARLGYHDSACERVQKLYSDAENLSRHSDVAELLAETYEQYTEKRVCDFAAKFSRKIIAGHMKNASHSDSERLIRILNRLAPQDKLLPRDGRRFVEERHAKRAVLTPVQNFLSSHAPKKMRLVSRFHLGLNSVWQCATTISDIVLVAGVLDKGIVFASCDSKGNVKKNLTPWPKTPVASNAQIQMFAQRSPINIFVIGEKSLDDTKVFTMTDGGGFPFSVSAGTPNGHSVVWGAAIGAQGQTWAIENRNDPTLVCIGLTGTVITSQSLLEASNAPWDEAVFPLPMHATNDCVLLGVGCVLLCVKNGKVAKLESFPSRITSMSGGQPYAAPIITISLENGAVLLRYRYEKDARSFASDMLAPLTLLNQGGFALAADENRIEVYVSSERKFKSVQLRMRSEIDHQTGQPIALLSTRHTNQITLVTSSGTVSVYEI